MFYNSLLLERSYWGLITFLAKPLKPVGQRPICPRAQLTTTLTPAPIYLNKLYRLAIVGHLITSREMIHAGFQNGP